MPNAKILTVNDVDYGLEDENGRQGIAEKFSTSANYSVGDYCWYSNHLYRFTTDHSSSTWDAAHATEVDVASEIYELKNGIQPELQISASMMESGYWAYSTKASNSKRLRNRDLLHVNAGEIIEYDSPTMQVYFGVLATTTSSSYLQTTGWMNAGSGSVSINYTGFMTIMVQSTDDITTADFDSTIIRKSRMQVELDGFDDKLAVVNNNLSGAIKSQGIIVYKNATLDATTLEEIPSATRVLIGWKNYGNTVLKITIKNGYALTFYKTGEALYTVTTSNEDVIRPFVTGEASEYAFVARNIYSSVPISVEEAYRNILIEEAPHVLDDVANGLLKEVVEFAPNMSFSTTTMSYGAQSDRAVSAPIKVTKGGIRITINPDKRDVVPSFRIICVKYTDTGLVLCEDNEDLLYASGLTSATKEPVYIPYVEDAYIIIQTATYSSTAANLVNSIWVYSGECKTAGKLLGLVPVRVFLRGDPLAPSIMWGSQNSIINTTNNLGGFLWLKYVKSIAVDPQYSIVANVYQLHDDGTQTLKRSYYANEFNTDAGRVSGVQYIDLSDIDFEGFIQFAIYCSVQFRTRISGVGKTPIGMGVMSKYLDVYNHVHVEYYNNYQILDEPGMPSVLFDNINDYVNYTYPLRMASYYVNPNDYGSNRHYFNETEDATPAFYDGYNGNTVLLNVTGKSYYTAMANPNSRCYNFARDTSSRGTMGYGITCTDFVCILLGLKENYFTTQFAYGTNPKFTRIKAGWDYRTEMDLLKPGDVLTQNKLTAQNTREGHCMIVYSKKYLNGQLEALTVIEAGYPYTRFTTLYNDKYLPIGAAWQTLGRLADYQFVNRIIPTYLNRLRDVYDLSQSYVPGTIMCDRGSDSIYCVNLIDGADPTGDKELDAQKLLLSITDDEATSVLIYKDDELLDTVTIGSDTSHGMRILDIRDYVTSGGVYTLKTDTSDDVQERFYVQEPFEFETSDPSAPTGYKRIHIPNLASLQYMDVNYTAHKTVDGTDVSIPGFRHTYAPEEFSEDSDPHDNTWGTIDVPDTMDVPEEFSDSGKAVYAYIVLIYGTDYGTFQLRYLSRNGTLTSCAYSGYAIDE